MPIVNVALIVTGMIFIIAFPPFGVLVLLAAAVSLAGTVGSSSARKVAQRAALEEKRDRERIIAWKSIP